MTGKGFATGAIFAALLLVDVMVEGLWRGLIVFVVFGGAGFWLKRFL